MAPEVERPTHVLHRLTCYTPDREWTEVPDDDRLVQDLVPNDVTRRPRSYKGYDADLRRILLPPDLPASSAPATDVLAGTAEVQPSRLDSRAWPACSSSLRGHPADHAGPTAGSSSSGRRVRGRPLPARALRRRAPGADVDGRPRGGPALVRPGGPRPRRRRSASHGRRGHRGRDGSSLAHGLALPGARLPPHLLGRGHDARPAPRPRGLGRYHRPALHDLPRRGGRRPRRRRPGAPVPRRSRRARPRASRRAPDR